MIKNKNNIKQKFISIKIKLMLFYINMELNRYSIIYKFIIYKFYLFKLS